MKKLVLDQSNVPGTGYIEGGFLLIAAGRGDPDGVAEGQRADPGRELGRAEGGAGGRQNGGGVVLNFTPPEALKILQAAQQQGLQDRVKWACSTPCNTDFLANALGPPMERQARRQRGAEPHHRRRPGQRAVPSRTEAYAPNIPLGSFSQMGFVEASIAVKALMSVSRASSPSRPSTRRSRTSRTSRPTSSASPGTTATAPLHIPNNTDRTVVPEDGKMVEKEGCFAISDVDPAIAQVRGFEAQ